jgi:hypothetical protein
LLKIDPLKPASDRRVEAVARMIENFLNTTTDWTLGRGSTGMAVRSSLELTRFELVGARNEDGAPCSQLRGVRLSGAEPA